MTLYLMATTLSPFLSSYRIVKVFGILALSSFAAAYFFYATWFISVWCFFAALLSAIVYLHFVLRRAERTGRRHRLGAIELGRSTEIHLPDQHSQVLEKSNA